MRATAGHGRLEPMARRLASLLVAALALAALLVASQLASGAAGAEAQDRVGAFDRAAADRIGGRSDESPCKRPGSVVNSAEIAAAYLVAAREPTLRHYTTGRAARDIQQSGELLPGKSGKVFVTPDRYSTGREAMERLSLGREPEGFFDIPLGRLPGVTSPTRVDPTDLQPGGGLECWVACPVDVQDLPFTRIGQ